MGWTHIVVGAEPQADGGNVERIRDEVHHVPQVAHVLLQPDVPQLLDLTPDQAFRSIYV